MTTTQHSEHARTLLKLIFGLVPIAAGLDKFLNVLTQWDQYLSPLALQMLPVSASAFMGIVGVIEIAVGVAILTKWTKIGAYVASAWLVLIALSLLAGGIYLDVAVRDLVMAAGAYTLGHLAAAAESAVVAYGSVTKREEATQAHRA
jgi:uncharacterized membrane protein